VYFWNFLQVFLLGRGKGVGGGGGGGTWMGVAWGKLLNVGSKVLPLYIPGKNSQKSAAYYIY